MKIILISTTLTNTKGTDRKNTLSVKIEGKREVIICAYIYQIKNQMAVDVEQNINCTVSVL
jgi:hypothetical protein